MSSPSVLVESEHEPDTPRGRAALALTLIAGCSDSETLADEQATPGSSTVSAPTSSAVASTSTATPTETSTKAVRGDRCRTDGRRQRPVVASPAEMAKGCAEAKAVFEMFDTTDVEVVLALMQASEPTRLRTSRSRPTVPRGLRRRRRSRLVIAASTQPRAASADDQAIEYPSN
ncbi:hypothetical protein GS426_05790 [Rhodococcus hoagii]|nr:hypothetical protein [Prescottella equi]